MDIFTLITPVNLPIENSAWLPAGPSIDSNSQLTLLRNNLWSTRSKLANYGVRGSNDTNTLNNYLLTLETYVRDLFAFLKAIDQLQYQEKFHTNLLALAGNLFIFDQSAENVSTLRSIIPWNLPISGTSKSNNTIQIEWTLLNEIQIAVIALSLLYFNIGLNYLDKNLYDIDLKTVSSQKKADQNVRWTTITNNFFKKSLSIIQFLKTNLEISSLNNDQLVETSFKFTCFISSYINANFQLVAVVIKNFWNERFTNFIKNDKELLSYNLQDLNGNFYKSNNYHLLIKISTYVSNELTDLLSYLNDFKQNLAVYYASLEGPGSNGQIFKSLLKNLVSKNGDSDEESEYLDSDIIGGSGNPASKASFSSSKKFFKLVLKKLNSYIKVVKIFTIYIKLYLVKYLSLDSYIMKNQTGYAISLINYGFAVVNQELLEGSFSTDKLSHVDSRGNKFKQKFSFKRKAKEKKINSKSSSFVSDEDSAKGNQKEFEFEVLILNAPLYKKYLQTNASLSSSETKVKNYTNIIIKDFNNLLVNLKNLSYKLMLQNDNLSFEKVENLSADEFFKQLPLGRQLPINLVDWDPINSKKTDDSGESNRAAYY